MSLRTTALLAALVALLDPAMALANNDMSTSYRAGSISVPGVDASANDASTVSVNQGKAAYSIPIEGPPGRDGVQPTLALTYHGGRSASVVGTGWSLGYPSIRVRTSGRGGQPDWGAAVRYLGLTGEELVELAAPLTDVDGDGVDEALFREERDTRYIRYVQLSSGGWRVDYPDGRKLTLGTTSNARVARAGYAAHIAEWLPEVLADPSGNELAWTWADGATVAAPLGAVAVNLVARYLTELRWGCQSCGSAATYQSITITYAELPFRLQDFSPGYLVETEFYVDSIETATVVGGSSTPVRTYALGYDTADTRRLLTSVAIAGADGTALPTTTIGYTDRATPLTPTAVASPPGVRFGSGVQPVDVDLDGRIDVADLGNVGGGGDYYRHDGGVDAEFGSAIAILNLPGASLVAGGLASAEDANRDLGMDVFDLASGDLYAHDGVDGWLSGDAAVLPPIIASTDIVRIDANSDGYVDLVDTSVSPWVIHLDDGSRTFTMDTVVLSADTTPTFGASLHAAAAGVLFGDVNGDGLVDVVYIDAAGTQAYWYPGRGRAGFGWLAEDGRAVQYSTLSIASGAGGPARAESALVDIDADGLTDLVSFDSGASRLRVWQRIPGGGFDDAGFGGPFVQTISAGDGCRFADWDMDGAGEVLCSAGWKLYDFADQTPFMAAEIRNGLGLVTRIGYTTTARVAAVHEAAGHPWSTNVSMAMPIVATLELDDSRGNVLVTSHDYRDATYEADELEDRFEFIGFGYIATEQIAYLETTPGDSATRLEDPQDPGAFARSFYDVGAVQYFLRGMPECQETWARPAAPVGFVCGIGARGQLQRTVWTNSWSTDGDGITTVHVDAEDSYVLEGGPIASSAWLRNEYRYDAFGNRADELHFGRYSGAADAMGDDEQVVSSAYVHNTNDWIVRLPRLVQRGGMDLSGPTPSITVMEETCFEYDGVASLCGDMYGGADDTSVTLGLRTATMRYTDDDLTDGVPGVDVLVESISYTATGMPATITTPDGNRELTYDGDFGLFRTSETMDPGGLNLLTLFEISTKHGETTRVTQPDGTFSRARYDDLGRLTGLIDMGDTLAQPTVSRTYAMGAPVSTVTEQRKDGTINGLETIHQLDGSGQLLCQKKEGVGLDDVEIQREYTARGLIALDYVSAKASACDVMVASAGGRTSSRAHDAFTYDAMSRQLVGIHQPSGAYASATYGVLWATEYDEEDNNAAGPHFDTPTRRETDGLGRVVSVIETVDSDGDGTPEPHQMTYTYDALDNVIAVADHLGATIFTAGYDSRGRRTWMDDANRGIENVTYDDMDRKLTATDARGDVVTYAYDAAGRVVRVETDDGATIEAARYFYDALPSAGLTAGCHVAGRLSAVQDSSGNTLFCYDKRGRITRERTVIDAFSAAGLDTRRAFDSLGRLVTLTHPDGTKLTYGYDDGGRANQLTIVGDGAAYTAVTDASYNAAGQLTQLVYGNGAVIDYAYDERLRPAGHVAVLDGRTELDQTLTLDRVGNVVDITDAIGHRSVQLGYDQWNRLVSATGDLVGGEMLSFDYDPRGNLVSRTSTDPTWPLYIDTLTYDDAVAVHALTRIDRDGDGVDDESFTYDASGHISQDGSYQFSFGPRGMLRAVDEAGTGLNMVTYAYDHRRRRVASVYPSGDGVYYVRPANAEIRDIGASTLARKRLTFAGHVVGVLEDTFTPGTEPDHIFLYAFDHLDSPQLVFDVAASPAVIERWASYPFGAENTEPMAAMGTLGDYRDPSDPTSKLSLRFQGREIDGVLSEFYDFGARVYRTDLGRFLSADPTVPDPGASQSWNRYAMVRNNPYSRIDPSGLTDTSATNPSPRDLAGNMVRNNPQTGQLEWMTPRNPYGPQDWAPLSPEGLASLEARADFDTTMWVAAAPTLGALGIFGAFLVPVTVASGQTVTLGEVGAWAAGDFLIARGPGMLATGIASAAMEGTATVAKNALLGRPLTEGVAAEMQKYFFKGATTAAFFPKPISFGVTAVQGVIETVWDTEKAIVEDHFDGDEQAPAANEP